MSSVVDSLPEEMRAMFSEIVGSADPVLLLSLQNAEEPSQAQRTAIEDILANEFAQCLRPDYEPTARGKAVDNLMGAYLLGWPIGGD